MKDFHCADCEKDFLCKDNLKAHIQTSHQNMVRFVSTTFTQFLDTVFRYYPN